MNNIILIGFMGSGKTTLGKRLAKTLGLTFLDADAEIERSTGMSVASIFAGKGETIFREMERDYLESLTGKSGFLLSTGGGMPCFHNNMDLLKTLGYTVYLKLPAEKIIRRLRESKKPRPLVKARPDEELESYVRKLLEIREPVYLQASLILEGKQLHSDQATALIENKLREL